MFDLGIHCPKCRWTEKLSATKSYILIFDNDMEWRSRLIRTVCPVCGSHNLKDCSIEITSISRWFDPLSWGNYTYRVHEFIDWDGES